MSHTILLVQAGIGPGSRTFCDYDSIRECMRGVCQIYEEHLKRVSPNAGTIVYDICQLFNFMDSLADIACLVYQKSSKLYMPHNKEWIKEQLFVILNV